MTGAKKVLIIGAGRRVQQDFLPAFSCLDQFELAGIHARTRDRLDRVAKDWNVPAVYTLDGFDFSKVDVVVVVVAHSGILEVLSRLEPAAPNLTLIIDTPVFAHIKDFRRVDLLQRYKGVLVAEDYPAFPEFKLMQLAIKSGLIGNVRHVHLLNAGWSYHGFSLIRKLLDYPPLLWMWATGFYGEKAEVTFRFMGGKTGVLVDPFDFKQRRILVAGDRGVVANYKLEDATAFHLESVRDVRNIPHYRIAGRDNQTLTYTPAHYERLASLNARRDGVDDFHMQKTLGLIDLIEEFFAGADRRYGYVQGLTDHLLSKLAYTYGFFVDPFAVFGTSCVALWDKTIAIAHGWRRDR